MPELPEVETVRRGLEPAMAGARIISLELRRKDLRFPFPEDFAARVAGSTIEGLSRRAKYLLVHLNNGQSIIAHLGMSGSFRIEQDEDSTAPGSFHHDRGKTGTHDHVIFRLENNASPVSVIYNDPRRFGFMHVAATADLNRHPSLCGLGIEPLGNALNGTVLCALFAGKAAPLKATLLDQRLIAGLGNIYVCESLWRTGLSPQMPAGMLALMPEAADKLAANIRAVLGEAVESGGSSLRDHRQADGSLGYFQHHFAVYDREGAACAKPGCAGTISRIVQSGRSTFLCAACQPFPDDGIA
jgi:formamidopyrimidine-DNA glycosylase